MNRNLILLLCKQKNKNIIDFENILIEQKIEFRTVCDLCTSDQDDFLLNIGFSNLTRSPYIKKPSAWDKAFYSIYDNELLDMYNYFFFIEDDVYSKEYRSVIEFIKGCSEYKVDFITKQIRQQSHHPTWKHWKEEYIKEFVNPSQSFNPLCRLSSNFIQKIMQYKDTHGFFNFHEILFASFCVDNKLSYINYIENKNLNKYFGKMQYHPIMTQDMIIDDLIYHPVKENICDRKKL